MGKATVIAAFSPEAVLKRRVRPTTIVCRVCVSVCVAVECGKKCHPRSGLTVRSHLGHGRQRSAGINLPGTNHRHFKSLAALVRSQKEISILECFYNGRSIASLGRSSEGRHFLGRCEIIYRAGAAVSVICKRGQGADQNEPHANNGEFSHCFLLMFRAQAPLESGAL